MIKHNCWKKPKSLWYYAGFVVAEAKIHFSLRYIPIATDNETYGKCDFLVNRISQKFTYALAKYSL